MLIYMYISREYYGNLSVDPCRQFGISNVNDSENVVANTRYNTLTCTYTFAAHKRMSLTHTSYLNSA